MSMYDDLSEFLRGHKESLGLSVEQIAQQLDEKNQPTHVNAIQRWLTGKAKPAAERFDTLLEVLGIVTEEERRTAYMLRWPEAAEVLCPGPVPSRNGPDTEPA